MAMKKKELLQWLENCRFHLDGERDILMLKTTAEGGINFFSNHEESEKEIPREFSFLTKIMSNFLKETVKKATIALETDKIIKEELDKHIERLQKELDDEMRRGMGNS